MLDPLGVGEHLADPGHDAADGGVDVGLAEGGGEPVLEAGVVVGREGAAEVVAFDPLAAGEDGGEGALGLGEPVGGGVAVGEHAADHVLDPGDELAGLALELVEHEPLDRVGVDRGQVAAGERG
ncbi:MAG TPA: hypothetical protein VMB50_21765, partial [Myxococcales bacterium]|nr:hypothetical protein [Myxococcales bacterium]